MRFVASTAGAPERLLQEAKRLARLGGTIALQEADIATLNCYPAHPSWDKLKAALFGAFSGVGADVGLAKRLYFVVRQAGLEKSGRSYKQPTLVMFSGATQSGCGFAQSAMGPFYCPLDQKVYLDTSFFQDLERRFRACDVGSKTCQFSQAYVIAHEIGHHVQNLLGLLPKVQEAQRGMGKAEGNTL